MYVLSRGMKGTVNISLSVETLQNAKVKWTTEQVQECDNIKQWTMKNITGSYSEVKSQSIQQEIRSSHP